jgi:hypothetical protein
VDEVLRRLAQVPLQVRRHAGVVVEDAQQHRRRLGRLAAHPLHPLILVLEHDLVDLLAPQERRVAGLGDPHLHQPRKRRGHRVGSELARALAAGAPPEKIVYSGVGEEGSGKIEGGPAAGDPHVQCGVFSRTSGDQ